MPINKFIHENKNKNQLNEIIIKVNRREMNGNKIYFLDNTKIHNNLKVLNNTNVELFINDKNMNIQNSLKMIKKKE